MALAIKYINTEDLIPYVNNSRTHSDEQISQVAASIKEFGFTNPLLIDGDGGIIAGHGRLQAAKKLKLGNVPTITLEGLTDVQRKAYVIADNKLALNASWDDELLALELASLDDIDFDLSIIGFDADEVNELFGIEQEEKELEEESYSETFNIIINCNDEYHQEIVYKKMQAEGYTCQVQSL
tara:strand:- start:1872 stop:2417 length:546 start_codon:yes stop_codon:yes gene_type:complete